MKNPKVSIIIVYYDGREELFSCLRSIKKNIKKVSFEVIVVNNSKDLRIKSDVKKILREVVYIKASKNLGYGAGNNLGVERATGDYLFILNPDTKILKDSIGELVSFLDNNEDAAIVAPNFVKSDGNLFEKMGSRRLTPLRGIFVFSFLNKLFPKIKYLREYYLEDVDKNKLREVGSVPGSAFMMRADVFKRVGMFDEKMFLYLEEEDLGKRVNEAGYKLFIEPKARVIHYWTSPKRLKKLKRIFASSRFYYFKKHYGLASAITVEAFARLSKWHVLLFSVFALATFLRFWNLSNTFHVTSEMGGYYLSAKDIFVKKEIPLVAIHTSVPILRQGAVFTWLLAGFLWVGNFNPFYGTYLTILLGLVSVIGIYLVTQNWFSKRIGIISSLIVATSPYIVEIDRAPFVLAAIFPTTLIIAYYLGKTVSSRKVNYLCLGFWISVIFQIELAGFILWPIVIVAFLWARVKLTGLDISRFILGVIIGMTPFIIWDLRRGVYLQTLGFGGWVFTKSFEGVFGIFTGERPMVLFEPVQYYVQRIIFAPSVFISFIILAIIILAFIRCFMKSTERTVSYFKVIIVWLFLGFGSFLIRGIYSGAYIPLLFFPVVVLLSLFFNWLFKKSVVVGVLLLSLIIVGNVHFLLTVMLRSRNVTFTDRMKVVDYIIRDSKFMDYKLAYRGPGYNYPLGDSYWRYLLWWRGNEPVDKAEKEYLIVEHPYKVNMKKEITTDFGYIKVGKKHD